MFFKPIKSGLSFIYVLGVCLLLWACSNKEKISEGLSVQLSYDAKCMNGLGQRISKWSKGEGSANQIQSDVDCLGHGIEYFLKRVRGSESNSYTNVEVFHILQKFFNAKDFDQKMVDDILEIKTWIMGGQDKVITRDELTRLSTFLTSTHPILAEITPLAFRLFFNPPPQAYTGPLFSVTEATQLRSALGRIIENLADSASVQSVALVNVARAYELLEGMAQHFEFEFIAYEDFQKVWSMVNVILGQDLYADIALKPRSKIYTYIEKVYFLSIRLKYGVLDSGWRNPVTFSHLEPTVQEALPLVEEWITNQKDHVLTRSRVLKVLELGVELFDIPQIDESVRELLVDRVYTRFFGVGEALDVVNYSKIKTEWNEFRNFQGNTEVFHGQRFDGSLMSLGLSQSLSQHNQQALDFLWPMLSDNDGYVLTDLNPKSVEANYGNLFKLNWQRALSRLFIQMYTEDPLRRSMLTGITLDELEKGYGDVFVFLKALDILSDNDKDGWFRIFNEANLFVPRAKPDIYLDYVEGVDYFAMLFSGLEFSGYMNEKMKESCPDEIKSCELQWLSETPANFWKPMIPQFGHYLRSNLPQSEWQEWAGGMEEVARKTPQPEAFKRSEMLAVAIASQYIEVFLRKYDVNQDQLIDFAETVNSFENFKAALLALPQIQGTAAENDPQTLLAVYSFFVRNGRLPTEVFGQPVELLGWLRRVQRCTQINSSGQIILAANTNICEYTSSRSKLMKILAFLSNAI